ncbi:acetylglutamate kinase [Sulfuriroseicoccus oceanibius]|uniref:Acetylglutamate kinase n=1 Tax=Sulfuriroseicoccus oceanibius TaxID=2707525 RepID=A0A6B3LFB1_9BACT|nr:acetylglutamate kinase [Sulfuriroseicoccus oceanibius]QQL45193.1 acetylglutamate kinase [Sulfuriroseicoccus oceanibius]
MNADNDPSLEEHIRKAAVLVEALPYMQSFRGETFLIKVGGSAMDNLDLLRSLMRDIVFLEAVGVNPVVVHGGGKAISAAMARQGLEPVWASGLRVTDSASIEVVAKTLEDEVNPMLVEMLLRYGGKTAGVKGRSMLTGERAVGHDDDGNEVDLGFVGNVTGCNADAVRDLVEREVVPVVSPLASEVGTGLPLNVNADLAAAAMAKELGVSKLIYLSDVRGLLRDPSDPSTLIPSVTRAGTEALIEDGIIKGGMIPKVRSAADSIEHGVGKVHMIDGRIPHALLLEVFTNVGIGTEILA